MQGAECAQSAPYGLWVPYKAGFADNAGAAKPCVESDSLGEAGEAQQYEGTGEAGNKDVEVAKGRDAWAASDSDKGSGASRRMQGACHKHEHNGRAYSKACRKPHGIREELCKEDACKGRDHVPAKDVAGTGQGAVRGAEDQHCRGAEGTYDEGQAHRVSEVFVQKGNAAKGKRAAKPDLQKGNGVRGRKAGKDVSEKKCFCAQGHRPP